MRFLCGFLSDMDTMVAFLLLLLASTSFIFTAAQELGHGCSDIQTQNQTVFGNNLDTSFASLDKNISSSNASFFATSVSNNGGTDEVYALLLCRKYLTSEDCLKCSTEAQKRLKQLCQGWNGGRIHLDDCFLRYENTLFFERGTDAGYSNFCASVYDSKPKEFNQTAQILLSRLIANASGSDKYAAGKVSSASTTVYGVAQCVLTLDEAACQACLKAAAQVIVDNCFPMHEGRGLEGGCFMRYATYPFYNYNITTSTAPLADPPATSRKRNFKRWPILLGSVGAAALFAALCSLCICRRFLPRFKCVSFRGGRLYTITEEELIVAETFEQVVFDYDVLRDATENFNNTNLVGKGGYGDVYKGRLVDGRTIAVKKLSEKRSSKAMEDFLMEAKLISSVRHRNLVRLLGCCARGQERLLVYEYMSNSSLDKHLFGDTRNHLDWETLFNIIVGAARGLAYLHEDSNIRIVHRDIKAANILLDDQFHPKIADFGLAKFFPEGETHVSTRVGGTIGYTAPEYAVHGQLSEKADVYSYGVLLLEIVSGRKCVNRKLPHPLQILLEWAWRQYQSEEALEIVDVRIRESEYPREQVLRVVTIALLCCQASPVLRPTMSGVVSMLTTAWEINVRPTQPAFIDAGVTTSSSGPSSSASKPPSASDPTQSHGSISDSLFPR